tara:strand:+ start:49 stop:468 length:420 start_codon:yes stop_codon:yes gene_type:complete
MKRFAKVIGALMLFASPMMFAAPASAIGEFGKKFKAEFADKDKDPDWYKQVAKANCNVCHVKGHPEKKEARNEYGKAVQKFLKKEDFSKEYVKENPEEAMKKIIEGLKKANELKSSDGKVFGEKIKAKELPATDAEYKG